MRSFLLMMSAFMLTASLDAGAAPALRDVMPAATQSAANVVPTLDPEAAAIAARYGAALAGRQEWLKGYAAQHAGVATTTGLLPYHPNMGISAGDYQTVTESMRRMNFVAIGEGRLRVDRHGDRLRLSAPDGLLGPTLAAGLTVDLAASTVTLDGMQPIAEPSFEDGRNVMKTLGSYVPGYVFAQDGPGGRVRVTVGRIPSDPANCLLGLLVQTKGSGPTRRDARSIRFACAAP